MTKVITDQVVLRQQSDIVNSVDEAKDIIEKLKLVLPDIKQGIGVAAIQIGIPKKIAVLRNGPDDLLYLINAELEEGIDETIYLNEGCLSIPGHFHDTKRYKQIIIKNDVIDGDHFREERQMYYYSVGEDDFCSKDNALTCIAIQHELDHFCGKLILDNVVKREPIVKPIKVGRNDPCPCGKKDKNGNSLKYKKCCLNSNKLI